jgi:tetratricopeptide (TPR) repeat protein
MIIYRNSLELLMTLIDDQATFDQLPWYDCSSRFCAVELPFVDKQLWVNGEPETLLLGWCGTCWNESGKRGRYVCTRCALREPASPEAGEWEILICRYCGEPLGQGKEVVKLDTATFRIADGLRSPYSSPDDENQVISSDVWWSLYQHGIKQGWVTTSGLRDAKRVKEEKRQGAAWPLSLLHEELVRCRAASYVAGEARCLLEVSKILIELGRQTEALGHLEQAEPLLQEVGNVSLLRDALILEAWAQRAVRAKPNERIKVLDEAIALCRQAFTEKNLQYNKGFAFLLKERAIVLLVDNQPVAAAEATRQFPEGWKLLRKHAEQMHQQNREQLRLPRHSPDVSWDEEILNQFRKTHDVWGCPKGHKLVRTSGVVTFPRGKDRSHTLCLECGRRFILLNRYYSVTASVPDLRPPGLLEVADWNQATKATPDQVEWLNLALVLRDGGQPASAIKLQRRVLEEWEQTLGATTLKFAMSLNLLGRVLQERDEHQAALGLFERANKICRRIGESGEELLANCLNNQGCSLLCLLRDKEAEAKLQQACKVRPKSPNAYYWLAKLHARRGPEFVEMEKKNWEAYVANVVTSHPRRREARLRLVELASGVGT